MTTNMHDEFKTLRKFDAGNGPRRISLFVAGAGRAGHRQNFAVAGKHPDCSRIGAAQLRREESPAQRRRSAGELERKIAGERGNSIRRRADCFAGFHRRAAGGRSWPRCAALCSASVAIRKLSNRSCRLIWSSITRCRWISLVRRERCELNLDMEFKRNRERYQFLKWGQQAFKTFQLIPPGIGIVHQVNLEYLAKGRSVRLNRSTLNSQHLLSRHAGWD